MPTERLLIFARYPRFGQVKTRLASCLTERGSYELHLALLLDTVDRTSQIEVERHLFLAGCSRIEARWFAQCHSLNALKVGVQRGTDLGERMWKAYEQVSEQGDSVVFLGTDSPTIPLSFIREAFDALTRVPVVLGPVEDGGYFLLGLSEPDGTLFQNIHWGTSSVFEQTIARLSGKSYELLPRWYDVDVEEDLKRLAADLDKSFEGYPKRTRFFFESWGILKNSH